MPVGLKIIPFSPLASDMLKEHTEQQCYGKVKSGILVAKATIFSGQLALWLSCLCTLRISTSLITDPDLYIKDHTGPKHEPINHPYLFSQRHIVDLFVQCSPIISLKLSILYTLLTPVLMQSADLVL